MFGIPAQSSVLVLHFPILSAGKADGFCPLQLCRYHSIREANRFIPDFASCLDVLIPSQHLLCPNMLTDQLLYLGAAWYSSATRWHWTYAYHRHLFGYPSPFGTTSYTIVILECFFPLPLSRPNITLVAKFAYNVLEYFMPSPCIV